MRILGHVNKNSGVSYHRVLNPLIYLPNNEVFLTNVITEEKLKEGWDIVVFNRYTNLDLQSLLYWRELYKFKMVCDVDDYWVLNPLHLLYDSYEAEGTGKRILAHVIASDLVTVTHERLAIKARQWNKNVEVLPNAVPFGHEQWTDSKVESDKVRLFWAGGSTHVYDMAILQNPMKRIYGELKDKVRVCFGGYSQNEVYDRMLSAFSYGLKLDTKVFKGLDVEQYMALYQEADIAMIPLVANEFNSYKSIIKILEAAAKKIPVVVSKCEPYTQVPDDLVNFVERQGDWLKHVKRLINDPAERKEQGERLHEWAKENYDLIKWANKRQEIYDGAVNRDTKKELSALGVPA